MKHIKGTIAAILALVFVVTVIICAGVTLSVRNVNISYEEFKGLYAGERYSTIYDETEANFYGIKGSNLLFLGKDKISSCVSDPARIRMASYEKKYPCSIDIVLSEREETFCSTADGLTYRYYDLGGEYMFSSADPVENPDGSPDIMIEDGLSEGHMSMIVETCGYFESVFGDLRRLIDGITFTTTHDAEPVMIIELRTGVRTVIVECDKNPEEKVGLIHDVYDGLSDTEKTYGTICCYASGYTTFIPV